MFVSPQLDEKARTFTRSLQWIFPGLPAPPKQDIAPLTRSEFLDVVRTLFAFFTLVPVLLAVSTFFLQERALTKEYEWRRKKEAQDIMQTWDSRTSAQKAKIESFFRTRYNLNHMATITTEDARAIWGARAPEGPPAADGSYARPEDELGDVKIKLIALLNYFETVSTACLDDIADQAIMQESLGGPMSDWWKYLEKFIAVADQQAGRENWKPYRELMNRWYGLGMPVQTSRPVTRWPMRGR